MVFIPSHTWHAPSTIHTPEPNGFVWPAPWCLHYSRANSDHLSLIPNLERVPDRHPPRNPPCFVPAIVQSPWLVLRIVPLSIVIVCALYTIRAWILVAVVTPSVTIRRETSAYQRSTVFLMRRTYPCELNIGLCFHLKMYQWAWLLKLSIIFGGKCIPILMATPQKRENVFPPWSIIRYISNDVAKHNPFGGYSNQSI